MVKRSHRGKRAAPTAVDRFDRAPVAISIISERSRRLFSWARGLDLAALQRFCAELTCLLAEVRELVDRRQAELSEHQ